MFNPVKNAVSKQRAHDFCPLARGRKGGGNIAAYIVAYIVKALSYNAE